MVSVVYSLSTKYATEMSECEFLLHFDKTDTQECFFLGLASTDYILNNDKDDDRIYQWSYPKYHRHFECVY